MSITKQAIESAFEAAMQPANTKCKIGALIEAHEHGTVIGDRVDDVAHFSAATISKVLSGLGLGPVSPEVIQRHRKGDCRCNR